MKSRHTWQRLSLGWKVSNELRVNWKTSLFSAFGFKRLTDANPFEGVPCPAMRKQPFVFSMFSFPPMREAILFCLCERQCSRLCERQCCPVSARDSILLASARGSDCLTSARGIVVSLHLAFSMHARFLPFVRSLFG